MNKQLLVKILRYGVYAAAFIPLVIFSQYISPFHFGKVVVFRSMIELMSVFYILLVWQDRSYLPRTTPIFWAFLGFAGAFTLTTISSVIPYSSFWGSLERMGGLWTFWHYFIFFSILTSVLRTRKEWQNFLEISIFVSALSALYGFGQKTNIAFFIGSGGRERIFGTIGNAALFAGYELLNFFLGLTLLFINHPSRNRKIFYIVVIALDFIAILMTAVRGSIMGLGLGLIVFVLLYFLVFKAVWAKKAFLGLIVLAMLFLVLASAFRNSSFVQNSRYLRRVTEFSLTTLTAQTRFWAWQAGIEGWKENIRTMVLGWGPENFNIPFSKHFNPRFFRGPGSETLFDRAHNMFIEILVTMGLVGELTYLWLFYVLLRELWRMRKIPEVQIFSIGFIPLILAYAIHNSFIFDTSANFIMFFSVVGFISYLYAIKEKPAEARQLVKSSTSLRNAFGVLMILAAVILIYKTNIRSTKANYATTRAIVAGWGNDYKTALAKFKESINYNTPGKYDYRHRMAQYILEYAANKKLTPELEADVKYVISELQKNADENPQDYLPDLYISRMYITLGKDDSKSPYNDNALEYSLRALAIAPKFVRTYYEIAQAYLNKKDYDKAVEYFQRAAELNPDTQISNWYWGVVELQRGNIAKGAELTKIALDGGYIPSDQEYLNLVNVYLKLGDYKSLALVYEHLVGNAPTNAQYHASLAVAYANIGNIDGAVTEARAAAKYDPAFEPEARKFVEQFGRQW